MSRGDRKVNWFNDILIGILFIFISLLLGAIGLRFGNEKLYQIALIFTYLGGAFSLIFLLIGVFCLFFNSKNKKPSQIRLSLTNEFEKAEANLLAYCKKLNFKTFLYRLYFFAVALIGVVFYVGVSLKILTEPVFLLLLPLAFISINPLWRALRLFLQKDKESEQGDITKEDFPESYEFFNGQIKDILGKNINLIIDFGSDCSLSITKKGKTVFLNINSYALMLFTKDELLALIKRECACISDKQFNYITKTEKSRKIFTGVSNREVIFNVYFSFIINDTATKFTFSKNALLRGKEKIADSLIRRENLGEEYLIAYKKQQVFDCYLSDSRNFLNLYLLENEENLKTFTKSIFLRFLELYEVYGEGWNKKVEKKLKAKVTDRLVYSEKERFFDLKNLQIEFKDNSCGEFIEIYQKYDSWYYEVTKSYNKMKRQALDECKREVFRYEQYQEDYDERLKLITVAHAYYNLGEIEKAEEVYLKIIESGDTSTETYFNYGCFLLFAKDDFKGVELVYKALENENFTDKGLDALGRFLIHYGDESEYEKYCEFKMKSLDKVISEISEKTIFENSKIFETELGVNLVEEITQKLVLDDNIEEIYLADVKSKKGNRITLFAISLRNKSQDAYVETFERIFSILDNEYGQIDSVLISVDYDKTSSFVKKMTKNNKFLIFKR